MLKMMRRNRPAKADPAPSRWAWRMQRLLLTPGFRLALRAGGPFCVTLMAGSRRRDDAPIGGLPYLCHRRDQHTGQNPLHRARVQDHAGPAQHWHRHTGAFCQGLCSYTAGQNHLIRMKPA